LLREEENVALTFGKETLCPSPRKKKNEGAFFWRRSSLRRSERTLCVQTRVRREGYTLPPNQIRRSPERTSAIIEV